MNIYNLILGSPFIYNKIRPLVIGGIDQSSLYRTLDAAEQDVVLDVGCGTGDALNYLSKFRQYWGFDIDNIAVSYAKNRFGAMGNVVFRTKLIDRNDIEEIKPTRVVLAGLLHHLTDGEVTSLFSMLKIASGLHKIVTQDIVYLPGELVSNFFAHLDRGRFCRKQDEYEGLVRSSGLDVVSSSIVRSHPKNGRAKYLIMTIEVKR
ncbi:class I SAM-dependent methyltransferase [Desulfobulbus elongatus]|uniref:class I SAM-dependent methyltransferase n=1 Tax=Desulfobulbus elongatus TaxID=53332 RepID=UPI0004854AD6|nr:class I SAM-dependent methyltransferase [Desulfobulbus elongatus]